MNCTRFSLDALPCAALVVALLVALTELPTSAEPSAALPAAVEPSPAESAAATPAAAEPPTSEPLSLPTARPQPTPCQVATPAVLRIAWPRRVAISPAAAAHFKRYNPAGFGSLIVVTRYDGSVTPYIPQAPEIDPELRTALAGFARRLGPKPVVACGIAAAVFVVRFYVPSGRIYHFELPAPPKD